MLDKTNNIIERVYKSFLPSGAEAVKLKRIAESVIAGIRAKATKYKLDVEVELGGSFSKGTWVRNDADIDVFVVFGSEKETLGLHKLIPDGFDTAHGTRVYFRGKIQRVYVEIVPLVRFKDRKEVTNSVDFSRLHASYINRRLDAGMKRDVVALKQFCKANGCFGAETHIHGFSGYALELMILNYGGIKQLFDAVLAWRPCVYIDIEKVYSNRDGAVKELGEDGSPILLVDPTNPNRNVCASLNMTNFAKFVFAVKFFHLHPEMSFFLKKDDKKAIISRSKLRGTRLFRNVTRISGPREKFLSKYNKNSERLLKTLSDAGVEVYDLNVVFSEHDAELFLEVANVPATKTKRVVGPNPWLGIEHFSRFVNQHREAYVYKESAAYDKPYDVHDFNKFILGKIKEYMAQKAILRE